MTDVAADRIVLAVYTVTWGLLMLLVMTIFVFILHVPSSAQIESRCHHHGGVRSVAPQVIVVCGDGTVHQR